ncbi:Spy/CpxP family protein refolding chaperone [Alkalimonas amylolytica]|uniref:LTXXQ motif family protein n=1 Tax=Alkalimonas amylolytica TaxID=152573 RepID=A0A1H3Y109_ALKAM|nr:Spy/CpxP family protein refolding chaperone [Alkalimonas amylolytica]SEA05286.1 LTXXQ motif family protein [Alkalimonas amylolytica]
MKLTTLISLFMASSLSMAAVPTLATELAAESVTAEPQPHGKRWQHSAKRAGMKQDFSRQDSRYHRHGAGGHGYRQLALSDEQTQQLQALRQAQRAQHGDRAEQRAQRQQLQQLVQADNFDATAARLLLEQRQQQQLEHQLAMLEFRHQLWQLLTPEQREQWQQSKSERQTQRRSGRHTSS